MVLVHFDNPHRTAAAILVNVEQINTIWQIIQPLPSILPMTIMLGGR